MAKTQRRAIIRSRLKYNDTQLINKCGHMELLLGLGEHKRLNNVYIHIKDNLN